MCFFDNIRLYDYFLISDYLQERDTKQQNYTSVPNGATHDDDNHARRDPMNLSPYVCSGLSTRKNSRMKKVKIEKTDI